MYSKSFGKSKTRTNNLKACFEALKQLTVVKLRDADAQRLGIVYGKIGQASEEAEE